MDENVHGAITRGLRQRGVDVQIAEGDIPAGTPDRLVLDRVTALGRVLFSQDEDLLREAAQRQETGKRFTGVVFAAQADVPIGRCVDDLELIALACEPKELTNTVRYLPL